MCEHGRRKSYCKICGGSSICSHGRIRYVCPVCVSTKAAVGKSSEVALNAKRNFDTIDDASSVVAVDAADGQTNAEFAASPSSPMEFFTQIERAEA